MVGGGSIGRGVEFLGGVGVGVVVEVCRILIGETEVVGAVDRRGDAEDAPVGNLDVEADLDGDGEGPLGTGVELVLRSGAGAKGVMEIARPLASDTEAPACLARILSVTPIQLRLCVAGADGARLNTAPQSLQTLIR